MSLIYQSLQKLQSRDSPGGKSGQGYGEFPPRGFRWWGILWVLLGASFLAAGGYIVWSVGGAPREQKPSRASALQEGQNTTNRSVSARVEKASGRRAAVGDADQGTEKASRRGEPSAENAEPSSGEEKRPRLLRSYCRRNGTRARLSLEFDRKPKSPETNWHNKRHTLRLSFGEATGKDAIDLPMRAARNGLDLSLESKDPLRLRLKVPELEKYSAFTLPGSGDYGPRFVLALRFPPKGQQEIEPGGDATASRSSASEQDSGSPSREERGAPAPEPDTSSSAESAEHMSGSMEVVSSSDDHSASKQARNGVARAKRLLEQQQSRRAARLLKERLRREPRNNEVRLLLSRALIQDGDTEQAASALRQGIHLTQESIPLRTRYAELLISEQRYRPALEALRLDNPPDVEDNVDYYALAAYARRKLGYNQRAARVYRALVKNQPEKGKWWMGLGLCLERLERKEQARGAYERALAASGLTEDVRAFVQERKQSLARTQGE